MSNLATKIERVVDDQPESPALSYEGSELSYRELWERAGRFAAALADAGVEPGDRVAIYQPNLPTLVQANLGALRAGAAVLPMNPQYKSREIGHMLSDSGARVVVTTDDLVGHVHAVDDDTDVETVVTIAGESEGTRAFDEFLADEQLPVVDRADDDVAIHPYTSGTTGTPKGVLLTHHNLTWEVETNSELYVDGIQSSDRTFGVAPLYHLYGLVSTMYVTLFNGGTFYPVPRWDVEAACELVDEESITIMHGAPPMYNDVINMDDLAAYDLSSLRFAGSAGTRMPVHILRSFEDVVDAKIYDAYGLTECTEAISRNDPVRGRRLLSGGKPLPGVDMKVVDESFDERPPIEEGPIEDGNEEDENTYTGEIVASGPNVMKGYYGLPDANEEVFTEVDGKTWLHTGDVGYRDEDDFFYVVDRKKYTINAGGYNVYPSEVEDLLFEHEAVADVAVVGVPDERKGETVKAFVVRQPGAEVTAEEIREFCLDNLAAYKHPRKVEFVDELPRTSSGKVQKYKLMEAE